MSEAIALAVELLNALANDPLVPSRYRVAARRHLAKLRELTEAD